MAEALGGSEVKLMDKMAARQPVSALPFLSARGLTKTFGHTIVIDGIDFDIAEGSLTAILGPSGCGKTTLLRIVAGFERQDEGHLSVGGISYREQPPERRSVNTVFQSYALFPHLTVAENIAFPLSVRSTLSVEIAARVGALLETVRLKEYADMLPEALSGGQQQRVAIARALAAKPHLLLLDEPLSALDRTMRRHVQAELKSLQRRLGLTFVFVTHDQDEAFVLADDIIIMNKGRIEQQGAPQEIYDRPANAFVAGFVGGGNVLNCLIKGYRNGLTVAETAYGDVEAQGVPGLPPGHPAVLVVRPEHFVVDKDGPIHGIWEAAAFQGNHWMGTLAVEDGNLQVQLETRPQIGKQVALSLCAGKARIVRV